MLYDIIEKYQLKLYNDIWHYSFQKNLLKHDYYLKKTLNGKISLYAKPYNQWSPAPIYTNFHSANNIRSKNIINDLYNRNNPTKRKVFWFLRTNSFNEYLEERTNHSSNPSKHFPTSKNYMKKRNRVNGSMEICDFDREFYFCHYNRLKQEHFYNAEVMYSSLINSNPGLPKEWIKTVTLSHNDEIVAIFLIIDDQRSISLVNLASYRTNLGFGIILCTDIIKHCCDIGYYSFDTGVSGMYGEYKDRIFLHSRELNQPKQYSYINKFAKVIRYYSNRIIKKKVIIFINGPKK
jgi:hypothetical protein